MNINLHPPSLVKGWKAFNTIDGYILMHAKREIVTLVKVTSQDIGILIIDEDSDPLFDEEDARIIADVIAGMRLQKDGWDGDYWEGLHPLLPISFDKEDLPDLTTLAALVYCWHTPKQTRIYGDTEHGYLHHVHFDGKCWTISLTQELELDYITQI